MSQNCECCGIRPILHFGFLGNLKYFITSSVIISQNIIKLRNEIMSVNSCNSKISFVLLLGFVYWMDIWPVVGCLDVTQGFEGV